MRSSVAAVAAPGPNLCPCFTWCESPTAASDQGRVLGSGWFAVSESEPSVGLRDRAASRHRRELPNGCRGRVGRRYSSARAVAASGGRCGRGCARVTALCLLVLVRGRSGHWLCGYFRVRSDDEAALFGRAWTVRQPQSGSQRRSRPDAPIFRVAAVTAASGGCRLQRTKWLSRRPR